MRLTIVHLYPSELNTYGDSGNVSILVARAKWRGFEPEVVRVGIGQPFDFSRADIVLAGGGQDRAQTLVARDLVRRSKSLHRAADEGVVMLAVCGSYQLFGHRFVTLDGEVIPGIGIFDTETVGSHQRMIGNIVVDSAYGRLIGFENHSGKTALGVGQEPLGRVVKGFGNDPTSGKEGAVYRNVFGTYLHGPLLSKNPSFADLLLLRALRRQFGWMTLEPLDDELAASARREILGRILGKAASRAA